MENGLRRMKSRPSGTEISTNCPGLARSATSGATSVMELYTPHFFAESTSHFCRITGSPSLDPRGRMVLLQAARLLVVATEGLDALHRGEGALQGGHARDAGGRRRGADEVAVGARATPERG